MTKRESPKPKFSLKQQVIYDGWLEHPDVRNVRATVEECDEDEYLYSRKHPERLACCYCIRLIGDTYTRKVCEDELSPIPPPKFDLGNLVSFDGPNPKFGEPRVKGSGIVVGIYETDDDCKYSYDIWASDSDLKTPFKVTEDCIKLTKKTKKKGG